MSTIRASYTRAGAAVLSGVVCLLVLAGCSGGVDVPKTYPVTGKVIGKNGLNVGGAGIRFESKDPNIIITGDIQEDGSFTLKTHKGKASADGAPEGEYRVTITVPSPADRATAGRRAVIPAITLPKTCKIKPNEENHFNFEVERPRQP